MYTTISANSVRRLLPALGYSRQSNRKADEGSKHPDRDAQFEHINAKVIAAQAADPVISSKVYFFTGGSDSVVPEKTVETGVALYRALGVPGENIASVDRSGPAANAGHSWVTNTCCQACNLTQSPSTSRRKS